MKVGPILGRCASENAIIVVRELLRLVQTLAAAGGAAGEVGIIWSLPVKRLHELLARERHQVRRAVAPVDPLLRVTNDRLAVERGGGSRAHVRVRHGEAE